MHLWEVWTLFLYSINFLKILNETERNYVGMSIKRSLGNSLKKHVLKSSQYIVPSRKVINKTVNTWCNLHKGNSHIISFQLCYPTGNYLFKVNNRNTRTRCEICSKLTIKTLERLPWRCSGVFIVNFEHISHLVLKSLLLTLSR